jgi:hypothetical protein
VARKKLIEETGKMFKEKREIKFCADWVLTQQSTARNLLEHEWGQGQYGY